MSNVLGFAQFADKRNKKLAEPIFQYIRDLATRLEGTPHVANQAIIKGMNRYLDMLANDRWWICTTVPKSFITDKDDDHIKIMFLNGRQRDEHGKHMPYISLEVEKGDYSGQGNDESAMGNLERACYKTDDLKIMALYLPMYITYFATHELGFKFISIQTTGDIVWMRMTNGTERITIYVNNAQTAYLLEAARANLARQSKRGPTKGE